MAYSLDVFQKYGIDKDNLLIQESLTHSSFLRRYKF